MCGRTSCFGGNVKLEITSLKFYDKETGKEVKLKHLNSTINRKNTKKLQPKDWNNQYENKKLSKQDILNQGTIYAYMYGDKDSSNSDIIKISASKLILDTKDNNCFIYIWGWPGPNGNIYYYKDYGITWAFTTWELDGYLYE